MSKVVFTDYDDRYTNESETALPRGGVTSFETGYDGGRFYLMINGVEVFNDMGAGNDFNVSCEA
jgi:hypothetical protein